MKKETSIVYTSHWIKDGHHCAVHSERKAGDYTAKFWFTDWNPFPCMHMVSTFAVVGKWLTENGWTREIPARISYTTDTIDETTGELIDHTISVYNYVPVHEEKTKLKTTIETYRDFLGEHKLADEYERWLKENTEAN